MIVMLTLSEIKNEHLSQIKGYLKEYLSQGHEITYIEQKDDHYAAYILVEQGFYTGGDYGVFDSIDGSILRPLIINQNYQLKSPLNKLSYQYLYSAKDFYKYLTYELAVKLLTSIKE